jgi:hypothetical protein
MSKPRERAIIEDINEIESFFQEKLFKHATIVGHGIKVKIGSGKPIQWSLMNDIHHIYHLTDFNVEFKFSKIVKKYLFDIKDPQWKDPRDPYIHIIFTKSTLKEFEIVYYPPHKKLITLTFKSRIPNTPQKVSSYDDGLTAVVTRHTIALQFSDEAIFTHIVEMLEKMMITPKPYFWVHPKK